MTRSCSPRSELRAAFSDRTRAVIVNTPHNPTGKVFSREELSLIAELAQRHDAIVLTEIGASRGIQRPHPGGHRELSAQPDRQGLQPRGALADRRARAAP